MFNVGSGEFLVIFLLALIVLGPDKLPETARKVGKVMGDLRKMSSGFQAEMREAMDVSGIKEALNPTTMFDGASAADTPTMSGPTTTDVGEPLEAGAIPASSDPDVSAPVPAPMPTEIRAGDASATTDASDPAASAGSNSSTPDITPAPRVSPASPPPAKGQQGAA